MTAGGGSTIKPADQMLLAVDQHALQVARAGVLMDDEYGLRMNSLQSTVLCGHHGGLALATFLSCPLMGHLSGSLCLLSLLFVTNLLWTSCAVLTSARRESRKSFVFLALPSCMPFLPGLLAPVSPGREDAKPVGCGRDRNVGVVSTSVRPELPPAAGQAPGCEKRVGALPGQAESPYW